ncbi:hypothetical protein Cfor_00208, partial [Coptotermes formosanus]
DEFNLSTVWHELIVSVTIGAAWLFSLIGGCLTDRVGRKPVILLGSLVFTAGSVIMGLANGQEVLLVGRLVVGVGIGMISSTVPVYIAESSPMRLRGKLVSSHVALITLGQFIASGVAGIFSSVPRDGWRLVDCVASMSVPVYIAESAFPEVRGRLVTVNTIFITGGQFTASVVCGAFSHHPDGWRYMLGLAAVPACIQFFGFLGMPESPRWLVAKKRYDDALKVLRSIRGDGFPVEEELEHIKEACLEEENELQERRRSGGVVISLVALGVGFHFMSLDTPPVTLTGDSDCSWAKTCTECISKACGFCYLDLPSGVTNGSCWAENPHNPSSDPLSGICHNVSSTSGLVWAAGWCPSRYSWIAVAALGIYLLFFAPGMGPMPWTINSEIYPMWARSSCNSVATSVNWMFNLLISMTFLTLTKELTKEGAFYLYAGFAGLGLISLHFLLPETKGRSLEEMEAVFSGPWCTNYGSSDAKNVQYVHIRGLNRDCREDEADSGDSDS